MQNSIAYEYVSEKLWDGLEAGCIPVYLGSPTAPDLVPDRSGVIIYDPKGFGDVSTPQELDNLMHQIGSSKERYEAMLAWKYKQVR